MSSYRQCGPWGTVMNQVAENTTMNQEAVYMPQAWAYAQQACLRCKDVNASGRRTAELTTSRNLNVGPYGTRTPGADGQRGTGLTHSSQYTLPYSFASPTKPAIPGGVGAYYGLLPPW